jgi:hypothetical protein
MFLCQYKSFMLCPHSDGLAIPKWNMLRVQLDSPGGLFSILWSSNPSIRSGGIFEGFCGRHTPQLDSMQWWPQGVLLDGIRQWPQNQE